MEQMKRERKDRTGLIVTVLHEKGEKEKKKKEKLKKKNKTNRSEKQKHTF